MKRTSKRVIAFFLILVLEMYALSDFLIMVFVMVSEAVT